jgi:hypothetical protein
MPKVLIAENDLLLADMLEEALLHAGSPMLWIAGKGVGWQTAGGLVPAQRETRLGHIDFMGILRCLCPECVPMACARQPYVANRLRARNVVTHCNATDGEVASIRKTGCHKPLKKLRLLRTLNGGNAA